jgi:serine phosphatase RsbU (regulator of sigma subunit)
MKEKKELPFLLNLCLWFLVFTFSNTLISQNNAAHKIDSLKTELKKFNEEAADTNLINLFCDIAYYYQSIDPTQGLGYAIKALNLAEKAQWKLGIANASNRLGVCYELKGNYIRAINHYNVSIKIFEELNNSQGIARTANNLGNAYSGVSNYPKALENYFKALRLYESAKNKNGIGITSGNIGIIYYELNDYENALKHYFEALKIAHETKDEEAIERHLANIGIVYKDKSLEKYITKEKAEILIAKALEYFIKSLRIAQKLDLKSGIASNLNSIAEIYTIQHKYTKALDNYTKANKLFEAQKDFNSKAKNLQCTGNCYYKLAIDIKYSFPKKEKQTNALYKTRNEIPAITANTSLKYAFEYLIQAIAIQKQVGDLIGLSDSYVLISQVQEELGKYKEALYSKKLHDAIKDSIFSDENKTKMATLTAERLDDLKVQKIELQTLQIEAARKQKIYLIIGLIAILVFVAFVLRAWHLTRKQKNIITEKNNETEKQKQIIEEKQKGILDSIYYAKRIQYTLLASDSLLMQNLKDYFILFKPKDIVSGDFYWATKKEKKFYLAICDSTGHGVPGAFMSLLNSSFLNEAINEKNILQPDEILNYVRERLIASVSADGGQDGMDCVLLCIENENKYTYAAAYNKPVIIRNNEMIFSETDKMPVGKGEKNNPFQLFELSVKKNDLIYIFTDGFADQFGGLNNKKYKYKKLHQQLLLLHHQSLSKQKEILENEFHSWKGQNEQVDDVLIIGIQA